MKLVDADAIKEKFLCCGYLQEISEKEFDDFVDQHIAFLNIDMNINPKIISKEDVKMLLEKAKKAPIVSSEWIESEYRGWISVEDRLPEDDQNIKKHIEGKNFGCLTVMVYNGVVKQTNRFFCNTPMMGLPKTNGWEWASSDVTHWMPMPEPPKQS